MSAKAKVILFIVVFCVIALIPFAVNIGTAKPLPNPSLDTPAIAAMQDKQCIMDTQYMRENHMQLLVDWRDQVVREGSREFKAADGQIWEKSLDKTCLVCHSNPDQFCDECHTYADVRVNCWDCHDKVNSGALEGR